MFGLMPKKMARGVIRLIASMGFDARIQTRSDSNFEFRLVYKDLVVGILKVTDGIWTFQYTEEFKSSKSVNPLMMFPDKLKVYESKELWPFFKMRVPSLKQPSIREIVAKEHIDEHDQVELLKRFGRRTITNPFELIATSPSTN